ncbi:hypothetical protein ES703_40074 [subsurface metagenome]|nr:cupin domain-containing protein [bacterium]
MESQNKDLRPQVFDLAGMLSYQDEAVVSRTIIDKKQGTVTLFAFDKDEGLSEHTAPSDAMVYILDGQAEISISGKPYTLSAGEMILMPISQPHALRALTRFKMLLVMVKS